MQIACEETALALLACIRSKQELAKLLERLNIFSDLH